jgi:hypothetical protein
MSAMAPRSSLTNFFVCRIILCSYGSAFYHHVVQVLPIRKKKLGTRRAMTFMGNVKFSKVSISAYFMSMMSE